MKKLVRKKKPSKKLSKVLTNSQKPSESDECSTPSLSSSTPPYVSPSSLELAPKPQENQTNIDTILSQSQPLPKKKRGRPRKNGLSTDTRQTQQDAPHSSPQQMPAIDSNAPCAESFSIPPAILKPLLKAPGAVLTAKTGWNGWELEPELVDELIPAAEAVAKQYLSVTGPHAPVAVLGGTLITVYAIKYAGFRDWKKAQPLVAENNA